MMAQHFQSGSPYGTPYSAGSYYPNYQQYPAQQPSAAPPFVQQNARPNASYQASPNHNMGRFEANSQAPVPQQNFPFAPSPFTPDMFKQFANVLAYLHRRLHTFLPFPFHTWVFRSSRKTFLTRIRLHPNSPNLKRPLLIRPTRMIRAFHNSRSTAQGPSPGCPYDKKME